MSAPDRLDRFVLEELRRAAVIAEGVAARARAEADAAWRDYFQALRDQAEDVELIGRQIAAKRTTMLDAELARIRRLREKIEDIKRRRDERLGRTRQC